MRQKMPDDHDTRRKFMSTVEKKLKQHLDPKNAPRLELKAVNSGSNEEEAEEIGETFRAIEKQQGKNHRFKSGLNAQGSEPECPCGQRKNARGAVHGKSQGKEETHSKNPDNCRPD